MKTERIQHIAMVRPDLKDYNIPVGDTFIKSNSKTKEFKYRWTEEDEFEIYFNKKWLPAQSIDFVFNS